MNGNTPAGCDKTHDAVTGHRQTALADLHQHVVDPFNANTVILALVRRLALRHRNKLLGDLFFLPDLWRLQGLDQIPGCDFPGPYLMQEIIQ